MHRWPYQGYGRGIPLEFIQKLTNLVCYPFRPDVTFLLDIEPEVGLGTCESPQSRPAGNEGRFEAEDLGFYNKVRDGYGIGVRKMNDSGISMLIVQLRRFIDIS
jgi:thymidylate kinase